MLQQPGICAEGLGRAQRLLPRGMERICSLRKHKGQCGRDLASSTVAEHHLSYLLYR